MIFVTMFCLCELYISIVSKPASDLASSSEVYSHFFSTRRYGSCPVSHRATWSCKPLMIRPLWGMTTHISAPRSKID